ncbi:MAG: FeoB-associated Cys-rich membrane protein [Eubacteriales bacterium]|nr:FeoB-associated Cys-rich membrane protein [Eubacteriales bacterium]
MKAIEIFIIVFAVVIVVGVTVYRIIAKKKGKTCCGDCTRCKCCHDKSHKS